MGQTPGRNLAFLVPFFTEPIVKTGTKKIIYQVYEAPPFLGARNAKVCTKVTPQIAQTFAPAGRPAVTISALENV